MACKDGREWNGKEGGVLYDVDDDGICTITMNRPEAMVSAKLCAWACC